MFQIKMFHQFVKDSFEAPSIIVLKTSTCFKRTPQLSQWRCDNVVTTSLLTLWQCFGLVKNESCADVSFRRCDNVALRRYQDVATTLLQYYNIKHLRPATLLKKELWYRCLPVNFVKLLRIPFLQNTSGGLLLCFEHAQMFYISHFTYHLRYYMIIGYCWSC